MELWNLVFMHSSGRSRRPAASLAQTVDRYGRGLERVAAAVQNVPSNYDTDLLRPLIDEAARISGKRYSPDEALDARGPSASMRVVADHSRAPPSCWRRRAALERGAGLRAARILRRPSGMRSGFADPSLYAQVCGKVIDGMARRIPSWWIRASGSWRPSGTRRPVPAHARPGQRHPRGRARAQQEGLRELAFKLHDTYGFPVDLTQVIAAESGASVDVDGFEKRMEEQRTRGPSQGRARRASPTRTSRWPARWRERVPRYEQVASEATLQAILSGGKRVQKLAAARKGR